MTSSHLPLSTKDDDAAAAPPRKHAVTTTLKVEGMTCGACTSSVESAFKGVDGVGNVAVSLVMERAVVHHELNKISAEQIKDMIEDRGFDAQVLSSDTPFLVEAEESDDDDTPTGMCITTLSVGGMTCGACTSAVEGAFKNVPGIKSVSVSLLSERAVIEHDPSIITAAAVAETIEDTGFDADVVDSKPSAPSKISEKKRKVANTAKVTTTTVAIEGMTCGACTSAVESGFNEVKGILNFNISLLAERAVIRHDSTLLTPSQIVEIIEDRGFDATVLSSIRSDSSAPGTSQVDLKIFGVRDENDAEELKKKLTSISGILEASIDVRTQRAMVSFDPSTTSLRQIVHTIEAAGFNALLAESDDNNAQLVSLAKTKDIQGWRRAFRISLSFAIPVFLTSMVFPMFIPFLDYGSIPLPIPGLWLGDIVCLFLTIPVQFGIGRRFYISAFRSLRHGSPTMDVLVIIGTSAAFFFSVGAMCVSILTLPHSRPATVFDTSTMLITFISLGRLLEATAKSQTSKALSRLMSLAPSMATIYADPIAAEKFAEEAQESSLAEKLNSSEQAKSSGVAALEKTVPTELLEIGDVVILRPGDKIPADGTVIRGQSYVDESMVTGEAMPILKKPEHSLMAGTVNGAARLDFRVTRAGQDTQLSQIVRLVQEAQTKRAPIQRLADLVAGYFVPVIVSLGALTFLGWLLLSHFMTNPPHVFVDEASGGRVMVCMKLCISVIVFACPCALGLSTPTAVMVGTGVGAEHGILIKGGAALETATKVTHVVFDKTGTLTTGKMDVAKAAIVTPPNEDPAAWANVWWSVIGLAESSSEHPIGKTITAAAKSSLGLTKDGAINGTVERFDVTVGKGVSATIKLSSPSRSFEVLIGNAPFLHANNIKLPSLPGTSGAAPTDDLAAFLNDGTTTVHTVVNSLYAGSVHLADTLKRSAAPTVTALHQMNISASIVTGDAAPTALAIATELSIPHTAVHASASPADKQSVIRSLQSQGHVVAMVGDGINDSPALATADIGISLASGTDVAIEAAEVVIMRPDDLLDVAAAFHLARSIFSRIKLNLAWACGYNMIGLPFAMGFFLPWGFSLHPMAAGAAMAASSVSVVVSSLLLKFWKRPSWMTVNYLEQEGRKPPRRDMGTFVHAARDIIRGLFAKKRENEVGAYVPLSDMDAV